MSNMESVAITTAVRLLESVPETMRERAVESLRECLADPRHEARWDKTFSETGSLLDELARKARADIDAGLAGPFDPGRL